MSHGDTYLPAIADLSADDGAGQLRFQVVLHPALEGPRSIRRIIRRLRNERARFRCQFDDDLPFIKAFAFGFQIFPQVLHLHLILLADAVYSPSISMSGLRRLPTNLWKNPLTSL